MSAQEREREKRQLTAMYLAVRRPAKRSEVDSLRRALAILTARVALLEARNPAPDAIDNDHPTNRNTT